MKWTTNARVSDIPSPIIENLKLKEFELKHEKKLFDMEKQYFNNLKLHQKEIIQKLKEEVSDYTYKLLLNQLKEIENEIESYHLDSSKIEKLKAEIDQLKEKETLAG